MPFLRSKFQERILNFKSKSMSHSKEFVAFEDIRDAVVFYDSSASSESDVIDFYDLLSSFNIKCVLLKYVPFVAIEESKSGVKYVCDKDVSIMGNFTDESVSDVCSSEFDVLFDLRRSSSYFTDFLAKSLRAKFVVTCSELVNESDVVINTDGDVRQFMNLSVEFLKKLR